MKKYLGIFALLTACSSGNCRSQMENSAALNPSPEAQAQASAAGVTERLKVFKYDGSLQCGMGAGKSVKDMAQELSGVRIYSSENKPDGLMHIQACSTPTGRANVYEIDKSSLEQAKKKGFKEWTFE
jgi:hypothetical protein